MQEEKSLLEAVRLNFGTDYYAEARNHQERLSRAEIEAWYVHPATQVVRNLLMGDMAELTKAWADGVNIDTEDPIQTSIKSGKAVAQMEARHDILSIIFNLRYEEPDDET